jgi:hypothetical protein
MTLSGPAQSAIGNRKSEIPTGYLMPVAYLWTRTVTCKNPNCRAIVPLVKQTWLCRKDKRYVALNMIAPRGKKQVRFEVVEARSENGLGFDPLPSPRAATLPARSAARSPTATTSKPKAAPVAWPNR